MTNKHKISLLAGLVIILAILAVVLGFLRIAPGQLPVSKENPAPIDIPSVSDLMNKPEQDYTNTMLGISFVSPSGFDVESGNVDSASSAAEAFENGTSYIQLFGYQNTTSNMQKYEVYVLPTSTTTVAFNASHKNDESVTYNGIQWFILRVPFGESESVVAEAIVPAQYPNVSEQYVQLAVAAFEFEDQTSIYSDELKSDLINFLKNFKKT